MGELPGVPSGAVDRLRSEVATLRQFLEVHEQAALEQAQRLERSLEEQTRTLSLLAATLESTTDGLLVVDLEGKIVSLNGRFVQMWGIPDHVLEFRDDDKALSFVLGQLKDPEAS